jgi:hypothetical protein
MSMPWADRLAEVAAAGPDHQAAGTGPWIGELTGSGPHPAPELADAILEQLGADLPRAYARQPVR